MNKIELNTRLTRLISLHEEIQKTGYDLLVKAIEAGEILTEIKSEIPHGEFTSWIETHSRISIRTAQRYMKIYNNRSQLKNDNVTFLSDAHKLLSTSKDKAEPSLNYKLIPPDGSALLIDNPAPNIWMALVTPHIQEGYYFRTWFEINGYINNEPQISVVGDKRGISKEGLLMMGFEQLFNPNNAEILTLKQDEERSHKWAGPWEYNEMLYFSFDNYLNEVRMEWERDRKWSDKNSGGHIG